MASYLVPHVPASGRGIDYGKRRRDGKVAARYLRGETQAQPGAGEKFCRVAKAVGNCATSA